MEPVTPDTLMTFLARLGERCDRETRLYLLGGSGLRLLGSPRETLDVDYTADVPAETAQAFRQALAQLADEFHLDLEEVPLAEFVPLPPLAHERHRLIGRFGLLEVYLFDPYSIALSKIARGFEFDLEDVLFLLRIGAIEFAALEQHFRAILPRAAKADIDPKEFQACFLEIRQRYSQT
ncbi:MAG: hypothetical protein CVU38_14390 [Chloroflexi bacterium HGW-Chloroflexi-1]|nr:MAG: hypothetical protein CVU38_14390 [Chloroflexi bacterium HGW-Chloroflexi-1]